MCEVLINTFAQGLRVATFCMQVGICEKTFFNWRRDHEQFEDAYQFALTAGKSFYEQHLAAQAISLEKAPNFNQLAMLLNNWYAQDYKRGTATDGGTTNNINTVNVVNLESMPQDQLMQQVQQLLAQSGLITNDTNPRTIEATYTTVAGEEETGDIRQDVVDVSGDRAES